MRLIGATLADRCVEIRSSPSVASAVRAVWKEVLEMEDCVNARLARRRGTAS